MKVLLCLVSDQHVPNLLSVHHFKPDRVILVRSKAMTKTAEYFVDALRAGKIPSENVEIIPLDDENNLTGVRRCLHTAFSRFPEADWIANVTGGLKPMSIAAYEFFKALDARVVYIESRQPNDILGFDGRPTETNTYRLTVDEFLAGYGFEVSKSWDKIKEGETRATAWWPLARNIAEHAPEQNLIHVQDGDAGRQEWKQLREKGLELQVRHTQHLPTAVQSEVARLWNLTQCDGAIVGAIDKYQGTFLTGGWLEVFLWKLLADHGHALGLDHIHLGVEAQKKETKAASDFDVAFMSNQSLGAIECKSGSQEHSDDPNQPLDKLEARIQQFRALRVSPILATTSSKILDANGQVKATFQQRANIYNCRIVTIHQLRQLAQRSQSAQFVGEVLLNRK